MAGIILTFDDGYRGVHETAWPYLKGLNIPACAYIATDFIDKRWQSGEIRSMTMNGRDILDLQEDGWEIGSHTHSHRSLIFLSRHATRKEIKTSIDRLKEIGVADVVSISYPGGLIDTDSLETVKDFLKTGRILFTGELRPVKKLDLTIPSYHTCETAYDRKLFEEGLDRLVDDDIMVFSFHNVLTDTPPENSPDISYNTFREIVELCRSRGHRFTTIKAVLESGRLADSPYNEKYCVDFRTYSRRLYGSLFIGLLVKAAYKVEPLRKVLNLLFYMIKSRFRLIARFQPRHRY